MSRRTQVRCQAVLERFAYGGFTLSAGPSQALLLRSCYPAGFPGTALQPHEQAHGLGSSPFARRYWGNLV